MTTKTAAELERIKREKKQNKEEWSKFYEWTFGSKLKESEIHPIKIKN